MNKSGREVKLFHDFDTLLKEHVLLRIESGFPLVFPVSTTAVHVILFQLFIFPTLMKKRSIQNVLD